MIQRRDFITLIGGAAAAWPLAAGAQQPALPVVGFLSIQSAATVARLIEAFRQGLNETGFAEGRNVTIEYSWADGHFDRMQGMASEFVRHSVAVIASMGGVRSALAAKAVTTAIPIVFLTGGDPVRLGLVTSLNRPDGNLTGVANLGNVLVAKQLQLLREMLPRINTIGFLVDSSNPNAKLDSEDARAAASLLGQEIHVINIDGRSGIGAAFVTLAQVGAGAALIENDGCLFGNIEQLARKTAAAAMPAVHARREFAAAGGLISYGSSAADSYRQVGLYIGRVLKGAKPADLPVVQSTKFELVINLKTAKALGIEVPPGLLATADEVIE